MGKREVAIKVLPAYCAREPDRLRRFELEAQSIALNHPNIVSIFYVREHEGALHIVTKLLQGETLRDRFSRGRCGCRKYWTIYALSVKWP